MPRLQPITLLWFAIAATVLLSDQYSKLWIMERYAYGEGEFITSFFNLVRAHNYGAAFSFLSDAGGWQRWLFTGLALVVTGVLIIWLLRLPPAEKLTAAALALIIGGAIGNLVEVGSRRSQRSKRFGILIIGRTSTAPELRNAFDLPCSTPPL